MKELEIRLMRELKHAMDNLEGLDPLQVGYKDLTEGIRNLAEALAPVHSAQEFDATGYVKEVALPSTENVAEVAQKETVKEVETDEATAEEAPVVEEATEATEEIAEPIITKEDLRTILKSCSVIDKTLLPELFSQFGASKLSEVREEDYFKLYKAAQAKLGDA